MTTTKEISGKEKEILSKLGLLIARLRTQHKMSRAELSRKSNLHVQYVYDVEMGKRNCTIFVLYKIAKTFNLSLSDFFKLYEENTDL
ncbi:MAG: helix-turn-helix transcriptional regulator [Erysipelotrichaceae bacterium]|nr:helix-turn-helix transcriptional regulator [Erysipelotrichaceae bacterium]